MGLATMMLVSAALASLAAAAPSTPTALSAAPPSAITTLRLPAPTSEARLPPPTSEARLHAAGPPPAQQCKGSPANRTDCGFTLGQDACHAKGCCYDASQPFTYKCFNPSTKCVVDPAKRTECGGIGLKEAACEAKGCCYDDSVPGTFYCYHSKEAPAPPPPPGPGPPPPPGPPGPPPSPDQGDYGNPFDGPCANGNENTTITGLKGSFCSPSCSTTQPCPSDLPMGTTAAPQCVLEKPPSKTPTQCALICTANDEEHGMTRLDGSVCPSGASCKPIQTTAICTYDGPSGPSPPGPTPPPPPPPGPTPPGPPPGPGGPHYGDPLTGPCTGGEFGMV